MVDDAAGKWAGSNRAGHLVLDLIQQPPLRYVRQMRSDDLGSVRVVCATVLVQPSQHAKQQSHPLLSFERQHLQIHCLLLLLLALAALLLLAC
jgi:hypothetical protein